MENILQKKLNDEKFIYTKNPLQNVINIYDLSDGNSINSFYFS